MKSANWRDYERGDVGAFWQFLFFFFFFVHLRGCRALSRRRGRYYYFFFFSLMKRLLSAFPPVRFAFAYGSGAIKQTGYTSQSNAQYDMIFVVDDAASWHEQNLAANKDHYSCLRHLGPAAVAKVQTHFGAHIYFNPFVKLGDQTVGLYTCLFKLLLNTQHSLIASQCINMKVLNI